MVISAIITFACKKQNNEAGNSRTFLKTYETDSVSYGTYVEQMGDGGYLIIGTKGAGQPLITRTDKEGKQLWTKPVASYCLNIISTVSQHWWVTKQQANLYTLQSGTSTTNIDSTGNIISSYHIPNNSYNFWANGPCIKAGTDYIIPMCNGNINYATYNYLFVLDQNLVYKRTDEINDALFGGKTLQFFTYNTTSSGSYYIWGQKLSRTNWSWADNPKIFIAKVHGNDPVIQTMIDTGLQVYNDAPEFQVQGPDSSIILLAQRTDYKVVAAYPLVLKFDKNLNLIWKKEFPDAAGSLNLNELSKCSDGGFLITGQIQNFGFTDLYPYALKIDANGVKQWNKTVITKGTGKFTYGIKTDDGGYALIGYCNAFGVVPLGYRILFIKTDTNGNL